MGKMDAGKSQYMIARDFSTSRETELAWGNPGPNITISIVETHFLSGPQREVWKTMEPFQQLEADFFKRIWESKPANQQMTSNAQDFYKIWSSSPVIEMKKVMAVGWISDYGIPNAHSIVFVLQ